MERRLNNRDAGRFDPSSVARRALLRQLERIRSQEVRDCAAKWLSWSPPATLDRVRELEANTTPQVFEHGAGTHTATLAVTPVPAPCWDPCADCKGCPCCNAREALWQEIFYPYSEED